MTIKLNNWLYLQDKYSLRKEKVYNNDMTTNHFLWFVHDNGIIEPVTVKAIIRELKLYIIVKNRLYL